MKRGDTLGGIARSAGVSLSALLEANGRTGRSDEPRSKDQKTIDAILDKISREGLQSLTDEEQEILRRAGRK